MRAILMTALLILAAVLPIPGRSNQAVSSNTDAKAILAQQQQIHADATSKKGRYRDMNEFSRRELADHQAKVEKLLVGVTDTTELGEHDRITLFNSLEAIEAIINKAEDERMVCERIKPSGSNRTQTVCRSVAERRADQQHAEQAMRRNQTCLNCSK